MLVLSVRKVITAGTAAMKTSLMMEGAGRSSRWIILPPLLPAMAHRQQAE